VEAPWVTAAEPRSILGPLASRVYAHPDRALRLVGVTGTNGKSTVIALLAKMLAAAGVETGQVGTLGYHYQDHDLGYGRTTPEASDLFRLLDQMRRLGAAAVVMEVSSHALELGRVEGAAFDLAVFTNLTRDHLDLHGDMESYYGSKRCLFDRLKGAGRAVVNVDDAYGQRLAQELPSALTCGVGGQVRLGRVALDLDGSRGEILLPGGDKLPFESPLLGRYNLANLLTAASAGLALDLKPEVIAQGIAQCGTVAGRLHRLRHGQPFDALVDYAHTPGALKAALSALRELTDGRLLVVFGCGGDRDPGKRGPMGQVVGTMAELAFPTVDNPRGEDPEAILDTVCAGLDASGGTYERISSRAEAIRRAVRQARPGDAVLVAGKGHESVQLVGAERRPFNDREVLAAALAELDRESPDGGERDNG
jgi:UDP-N-acetylmuramoyl-L-alanyl-D-glutamate--2,6-diaminopimelate ligase